MILDGNPRVKIVVPDEKRERCGMKCPWFINKGFITKHFCDFYKASVESKDPNYLPDRHEACIRDFGIGDKDDIKNN